jgi:hypothetical protein
MKLNYSICSVLITVVIFTNCQFEAKRGENNNAIRFKKFDIFLLQGSDPLKEHNNDEFVEVEFKNELPVSIKYYEPTRTVLLTLEDSFNTNGKRILVYATSNFHGGLPGRNKIYSGHTEEYKDLVFVSLSDTIICKSYQIPPPENYDYALYFYTSKNNMTILKYQSGRNSETDIGLGKEEMYKQWKIIMNKQIYEHKIHPSMVNHLPE